jgi:hypothetical protein
VDPTSARGKAGLYGGRSLVKSYKDTILLVWPFVLWGAVVIALAANAVVSLNVSHAGMVTVKVHAKLPKLCITKLLVCLGPV